MEKGELDSFLIRFIGRLLEYRITPSETNRGPQINSKKRICPKFVSSHPKCDL